MNNKKEKLKKQKKQNTQRRPDRRASKKATQTNSAQARYRGLIVSVVIFLLLIIVILGVNLFTSTRLNQNAVEINASGRMRDLSESMTRDLFSLKMNDGDNIRSPYIRSTVDRLSKNEALFTHYLAAFDLGGQIKSETGQDIEIAAVTIPSARSNIETIKQEWNVYSQLIRDYLKTARDIKATAKPLDLAINQAQSASLALYNATNHLSQTIEVRSYQQAELLRSIQLGGIALVMLYFIFFMFYFIRKLRASDKQAAIARKETDDIMATISDGLFLVDKDLHIGSQYSAHLESILGQTNVAERSLDKLLESLVSQKDLETTRSYVGQLFNKKVKARLIMDLNPLNRVETQISDDKGHFSVRYLNFNFSRVYEGKDISRVLVGVSDITDKVKLERRLEREQLQYDQQMEMLTAILHADLSMLDSFLKHGHKGTEKINSILKHPGQTKTDLLRKTQEIYRVAHSLKGEASALGLESFVSITHELEDKLKTLQDSPRLSGNDFLSLTVTLDALIDMLSQVEFLIMRLGGVPASAIDSDSTPMSSFAPPPPLSSTTSTTASSEPITTIDTPSNNAPSQAATKARNEYYQRFVNEIAKRHKKSVILKTQGIEQLISNAQLSDELNEIIIQLIRNAIVHGIESPQVRTAQGKAKNGQLQIRFAYSNDNAVLVVEDDGQGIDYDAIREKAQTMNLVPKDALDTLSPKKLITLLFHSGFSTADSVDEDAGRGVGLDIIKSRIKAMDGKIQINTKQGQRTAFTIRIPQRGR